MPGPQMDKARREIPDGPFGPVFRVEVALANRQKPLGFPKQVRFHFIAPPRLDGPNDSLGVDEVPFWSGIEGVADL